MTTSSPISITRFRKHPDRRINWRHSPTCATGIVLTVTASADSRLDTPTRSLVIGLVNNMPDGAIRTTELLFRDLLSAAAANRDVSLKYYYLSAIPRGLEALIHLHRHYAPVESLWSEDLDGLIVTGTEPHHDRLIDEPYWPQLVKLIDWAGENTLSTIWSCLAAHSVALQADGILRRRHPEKIFGIYECARIAEHPILAGTPPRWRVPHSRYNGLDTEELEDAGYCILSRSEAAGVDMFIKPMRSLFVLVQGHPEYDAGALLREYLREIRRFHEGRRSDYPALPTGYFDSESEAAVRALRPLRRDNPETDPLDTDVARRMEIRLTCAWRPVAMNIYRNWLSCLSERKSSRRANLRPA